MKDSIFREKSLNRISSPEEIDDYMKVTSTGMWLAMAVILLLFAAAVLWSVTARIEATQKAAAHAKNGQIKIELLAEQADQLVVGTEVRVGSKSGQVTEITEKNGKYLVAAFVPDVADGAVLAVLVTERMAPISFLIN